MQKFISKSGLQTRNFAKKVAMEILFAKNLKQAFVLGLVGDLGAGKTTFVQGLGRALGVKGRMLSPTFLLMRRHELKNQNGIDSDDYRGENGRGGDLIFGHPMTRGHRMSGDKRGLADKNQKHRFLYHIDAYRLYNSQELLDLGWERIIADEKNIVVVEWADKIKDLMPKNTLWINFEHGEDETMRGLTLLE